jgi:hypothetical protein
MALTRPRYSNIVDTDYKASCRVVTTTNVTLSGGAPAIYDGVSLNIGDRVLVTAQNTASQNGIYVVQSAGTGSNGTWVRSFDANDGERLTAGLQTNISEGTYAGKNWRLTTPDPITVGVTSLTFIEGTTVASGANRNLQFNNSNALAGATGLDYYTGNLALVASGNVHATANLIAGAVYTNQLLWQANSQPVALTGNINPTIYVGNTQVSTTVTRVDTLPAAGNAYVRWNVVAKDQVNNRYRFVTIESVNDTSSVYYSEYGSVKSNAAAEVAEFTSNISSGNINLWATGDSATVYVNFQRTMLGSFAPTGYINNFGPIGPAGTIAETSSNIVTTATSAATSTTTGALQIAGGAGIAGNAYIGGNAVVGTDLTVLGNLYVQGDLTRINAATITVEDLNLTLANGAATAGAANGAGISVDGPAGAQIVYIASGDRWNLNKDTKVNNLYSGGIYWSGNNAVLRTGINYYNSVSAPTNPNYGDKWYDTSTDILYEWQTSDGANGFWVDVGSLAITSNSAITANIITSNITSLTGNISSTANISFTGNITAANIITSGELFVTGTAWASYAVLWTADGVSQPDIGNGTLVGKFKRIGKVVFVHVTLTTGTTTTYGSGTWRFSLPLPATSSRAVTVPALYLDNGIAYHAGQAITEFAGNTSFVSVLSGGSPMAPVTSTNPFTWVGGDSLTINGSYEAV